MAESSLLPLLAYSIADERRKRVCFRLCPTTARSNGRGGGLSAQVVGANEDLILQILYLLPIPSLLRFKAVSKFWHSIISDSLFAHRYSIRQCALADSISGFLFKLTRLNNYKFAPINVVAAAVPDPCHFFRGWRGFQILHSCNGLLLYCKSDRRHNLAKYYVCNPITNEFIHIRNQKRFVVCSGLAFDPSNSPHYKVVLIERSSSGKPDARILIYSSETGSWRCSKLSLVLPQFPASSVAYYDKVALWKGALHWAGDLPSTLSFDVERECFWETQRPDSVERLACLHISVSCGRLKLIEADPVRRVELSILEMSEDFKRWRVKNYIDLGEVLQPLPDFMLCLHLLNGHKEESEEELLLQVPRKIISYRIRDGKCQDVCQVPPQASSVCSVHAYSYTLCSVRPPAFSSFDCHHRQSS